MAAFIVVLLNGVTVAVDKKTGAAVFGSQVRFWCISSGPQIHFPHSKVGVVTSGDPASDFIAGRISAAPIMSSR